jgi:hypothetical protein
MRCGHILLAKALQPPPVGILRAVSWDRGRLARRSPQEAVGTALPVDVLEMGLDLKAKFLAAPLYVQALASNWLNPRSCGNIFNGQAVTSKYYFFERMSYG